MNRLQKVALWVGVGVAVLMVLYPPWESRPIAVGGGGFPAMDLGYAALTQGPTLEALEGTILDSESHRYDELAILGARVNLRRLLIQWAAVAMVVAATVLTVRDKRG